MNTVRNHFFPSDPVIPSRVKHQRWISVISKKFEPLLLNQKDSHSHSDNSSNEEVENFRGKWLLFNDKEQEDEARGMTQHDYAWQVIKRLVEKDELYAAKCSTACDGQYATRPGSNFGVICCYTLDYTNEQDVKRVADAIRQVYCYPKDMFYKTDNDTRARKYKCLGEKFVSIYKHTVDSKMYERDSVFRYQWNIINV
ncbi:uncharacterized protein TNCT_528901 [Trichonephila clavata]|uniref:Uncharacterized protein n=1 Tax=Trichonephila clavata TaxID=2740835 RepID=A0A8X6HS66_TRICU|nr:uncharacterized protein TNCT_528901 [Trichonephila clavata]